MHRFKLKSLLLACVLGLAPFPAFAGRSCEERPLTVDAARQAFALTERVQETLSRYATQAAIIARVGSDLSRYGLHYTHAALAYRGSQSEPWTVYHKLNQCGAEHAALYVQGLANFLLDDPYEYRVLVLVPNEELQARWLAAALAGMGERVHERRYSLIAHPYSQTTQNSNGWLLELLASAETTADADRASAQAALQRSDYRPHRLSISPLERLGATLFKSNISFQDHPLADRLRGRYAVVTVESIRDYLLRKDPATSVLELTDAERS